MRFAAALILLALAWPAAARAQAEPAGSPPAAAPAQPAPAQGEWQPVAPTVTPYAPPGSAPTPGSAPAPGYAPPPGNAPPPGYPPQGYYPPPGAGWGAPPAPRWVAVDVRSDDPRVRIDRVVGDSRVPVCSTPCRKMLDTGSIYVIEGDGVRATRQFVLPDDRNAVTLDVQAGSSARFATGVILVGAGVVVSYVGALVWEAGTLSDLGSSSHTNAARTGGTMVLVGVPAALIGLYLTVTTHTSVSSSTGATFTLDAPPQPRRRPWIALTPRGLEF